MSTTPSAADGFGAALGRLRSAQKSSKGAPPYSLFVNRPAGRLIAAAAYRLGLTPNQVTYISAAWTFGGIALLGLAPPTAGVGLAVALLLMVGYAFDAADGQLARLRGGGSLVGEWLDHMIDAVKISALHLAVAVTVFRSFEVGLGWLIAPLAFTVVASVHFFGMILVDLLTRAQRARAGLGPVPPQPASLTTTLLKLPTDYGVLCLSFVLLGARPVFLAVYAVLAAASAGYLLLVVRKWRGDVAALDAIPTPGRAPAR